MAVLERRAQRSIVTSRIDPTEFSTAMSRRIGYKLQMLGGVTLYRFHDRAGRLLYVGITSRQDERWTTHRRIAPWWSQVAHVTCQQYGMEWQALAAERAAIKSEHPLYNKRSAVRPDAT